MVVWVYDINIIQLTVMKLSVCDGSSYGHQSVSCRRCTSGWQPSVQRGSTSQVAGLTLLQSRTSTAVQSSMLLSLSTDRCTCQVAVISTCVYTVNVITCLPAMLAEQRIVLSEVWCVCVLSVCLGKYWCEIDVTCYMDMLWYTLEVIICR